MYPSTIYKGTNPTALKSQNALLETMINLLKNKDYSEISISQICEQSGVSRQTFYKLFETKENLLLFVLQNASFANQKTDDETHISLQESCQRYAKYIVANQDLFKMLIKNNLMQVLYQQMHQAMSSCEVMFWDLGDDNKACAVAFFCAGLCGLTQTYFNQNEQVDEQDLADLAYRLLSGKVYQAA